MSHIEREKQVVALMIALYCRHNHKKENLCTRCADLLRYAHTRLDHCPHGNAKPSCRKCHIHCYAPAQRDDIRSVMAFAGPRMILHHPIAAIRHMARELF